MARVRLRRASTKRQSLGTTTSSKQAGSMVRMRSGTTATTYKSKLTQSKIKGIRSPGRQPINIKSPNY